MTNTQFGFTPQKNTIDAAMETKRFIEPILDSRGAVIMTSLDVKGAFDAASWQSILHGLKELNCPRNLYNFSKGYFSHRTAVMTTNNVKVEKRITKGCPQGSCCGPGFCNVLYNSLLNMELITHSKAIAFADDIMILTRGDSVAEAENYTNIETRKIQEWAIDNKITFNENKSKAMLITRRRRKRRK